ncbi:MAG TPA: hypothetical protein VN812_17920 [Candidatus Acidoferrales bacterium]|nr:hypothetical protein [Candidatus Acidoferrales bacterium]
MRTAVGVAAIPEVVVAVMVSVEAGPEVAVRTMVGVEAGSVRTMVGVETAAAVFVRTMVGVETALGVAVRGMVGVGTASVLVLVGVKTALGVAVRGLVGVAEGGAATVRMRSADTAPGPGFATVMLIEPAFVALPVAVSCAGELKVVCRGTPFHSTRAPLTKPLPMTFSVNDPSGSGFGLRVVSDGVWLITVITHVAEFVDTAVLVAVAVTFQPAGGVAGAVYLPVLSMKPTTELPPAMPLTDQRTAVVATPFAYAVNRRSPPTATLADVGETVNVWAMAGAAAATINRSNVSVSCLWPCVRTFIPPRQNWLDASGLQGARHGGGLVGRDHRG